MDGTGMNIMDRKLGHIIQLDANVMLGGGGWGGGGGDSPMQ